MRRTFAAFSLLVPLLTAAAPAPASGEPSHLAVRIDQGGPEQIGGATDPGLQVDVTVRSPRGKVKAVARTIADGTGAFFASLPSGPLAGSALEPGDSLEIMLGGVPSQTYALVYSQIVLTGFNARKGTITGKVAPRRHRIVFTLAGERIVADPVTVAAKIPVAWATGPSGRRPGPGGTFRVTPALTGAGWSGTFRRGDQFRASYTTHPVPGSTDYSFTVTAAGFVPGLALTEVGSNGGMLFSFGSHAYACRLLSDAGAVRARTAASVTRFFGPVAFLVFAARDGRPVATRPGDRLRVSGTGGFAASVPRLTGIVRTVANRVTVLGPPRSYVEVSFRLYDDAGGALPAPSNLWVRTDRAGRATASPDGANPLRLGDQVFLSYRDRQGHTWGGLVQALPSEP